LKSFIFLLFTFSAFSADISISSEHFIKSGSSWTKGDSVLSGTTVKYVNAVVNNTDVEISDIVIDNSVPSNMKYVSSSCSRECSIQGSSDGTHFYEISSFKLNELKIIRWTIFELKKKEKAILEYKAISN